VSTAALIAAMAQEAMAIAADATRLRSERWEALARVTIRPCTNTREMIFGPTPILSGTLRVVRETLARFDSERQWLDNMDVTSGRVSRVGWGGRLYGNVFARCTTIGTLL
jgi:hypothetical protein